MNTLKKQKEFSINEAQQDYLKLCASKLSPKSSISDLLEILKSGTLHKETQLTHVALKYLNPKINTLSNNQLAQLFKFSILIQTKDLDLLNQMESIALRRA